MIRQAPRTSALVRATNPEMHEWGLVEQLLADIADHEHIGAWQRSGGKKKDYPKPIPRPGVEADEKRYGKKPLPLDAMKAWLGW